MDVSCPRSILDLRQVSCIAHRGASPLPFQDAKKDEQEITASVAFSQGAPLSANVIGDLYRSAIDSGAQLQSFERLRWGSCNDTYRVDLTDGSSVVLRVAPPQSAQFRAEALMIRNSHAVRPFVAHLGRMVPTILFADFTHTRIERDYLFESLVVGTPAPEALAACPLQTHTDFFRQVGETTRRIHDVTGRWFGPAAGPYFATWSAALRHYFTEVARDLASAGSAGGDAEELAAMTERFREELDWGTTPQLMHGDGWTANFLVADALPLQVTGLCDWDRAEWGDPLADWAVQRALIKPSVERDAFWMGYMQGPPTQDGPRPAIYRARHLLSLRLDLLRHGRGTPATSAELNDNYEKTAALLVKLAS